MRERMPRRRRNPDEERYGPFDSCDQQLESVDLADDSFFVPAEVRELAQQHGCPPRALNGFAQEVRDIRERAPAAYLDEGRRVVVTSMDETPWGGPKGARKAIEDAADALLKVEDRLGESLWRPIIDCHRYEHRRDGPDRTVRDVLCEIAGEGELPGLVAAVFRLREVMEEAAGLDGVGGNPGLASWHDEVADAARAFWEKHRRGEPATAGFEPGERVQFNRGTVELGREPTSPFARFFCDVTAIALGWDTSHAANVLTRRRRGGS
jgi:hypothetical protein